MHQFLPQHYQNSYQHYFCLPFSPSFVLFLWEISASLIARSSSVVYCCRLLDLSYWKLSKTKITQSVATTHKKKLNEFEQDPSVVQEFLSLRLVETGRKNRINCNYLLKIKVLYFCWLRLAKWSHENITWGLVFTMKTKRLTWIHSLNEGQKQVPREHLQEQPPRTSAASPHSS